MPDSLKYSARAREFLIQPSIMGAMIASIALKKSPHGGLTPFVNQVFPGMTDGEKTTLGKVQRKVLEEIGCRHERYGVPIDVEGCQMGEGSTYTLPPNLTF